MGKQKKVAIMKKCLVCENSIGPFMTFGKMPIANGFLTEPQFKEEYFFELSVGICEKCGMFQLIEQPDRDKMFNDNYAFFSGTSQYMTQHFKKFADHAVNDYIKSADPFVVEIGSNDGIMLQNFAQRKIRHLGVEPSSNVAKVAIAKGVKTVSAFFDENLARKIVSENGNADAFLAANVMCHIPYIHSVIKGIKILLKKDGVAMFEDPYLGDVIEKISYDQIYDEHVFLFSLHSISYAFCMHGMEIIDVEPQKTHGGSMRYIIANKGVRAVSSSVKDILHKEKSIGIGEMRTYESFRKNCEKSRDKLRSLLDKLSLENKKIVGYAATSKSTTVINYCGITTKHLEYISDTTPIKQEKFSPGAHIPVKPYQEFCKKYPDYALLFAWNHSNEIMDKEKKFIESKGKWILFVPEVKVL